MRDISITIILFIIALAVMWVDPEQYRDQDKFITYGVME